MTFDIGNETLRVISVRRAHFKVSVPSAFPDLNVRTADVDYDRFFMPGQTWKKDRIGY